MERGQISLQTGILNGDYVSLVTRFVEMRMPVSRRRDERHARLPVDARRLHDVAGFIQFGSDQRVDARLAAGDEIERDRLVAMRLLNRMWGDDAEHRPQRMRDRTRLREVGIAQQYADTVALARIGIFGD